MDLSIVISLLLEFLLFLVFIELSTNDIIIMSFPVSVRGLRPQDLLIGDHFLVVKLQVVVRNDVVIFEVLVHIWWEFHLQKI